MSHKKSKSRRGNGQVTPTASVTPAGTESPREQPPVRVIKHLNTRFLLGLGATVALLATVVHFLHEYQVNRSAVALKDQAEAALAAGESTKALDLLGQYLQFRPDDLDATSTMGDILDQSAPTAQSYRQVYRIYSRILRDDPERDDAPRMRYRLSQLMLGLGEFTQAEGQIARLHTALDTPPTEEANLPFTRSDLLLLAGRSAIGLEQNTVALATFLVGLTQDPSRVEHYASAIELAGRLGNKIPDRKTLLGLVDKLNWKSAEVDPKLVALLPERAAAEPKTEAEAETPPADVTDVPLDKTAILKTAADPLIEELLRRMPVAVVPAYKANIVRASYYAKQGNRAAVEAEIKQARAVAENVPEVRMFAATMALGRSEQLELEGRLDESLESIDESIELAEAGLAQDPLNLGYELLWCRAQLRKLERERTPDAQQKHLAAIESRLAKAIERIPAAREAALKSEKRDERDSKLMQAAQFELDLRTELVDIKLAMLELGGLANAEIPKKQAEVGKLIDELQSYINSPGAIQFLRAKRQYIDLIVANRRDASAEPNATWSGVAAELQKSRLFFMGNSQYRRQVDLMLARCYQELQSPEARVALLRDSLLRDPAWRLGRVELAKALEAAGSTDEAFELYYLLWEQYQLAGIPEKLIEIQINQELRKPADQRNFEQPRAILNQLISAAPEYPVFQILDSELKAIEGDPVAAEQNLRKLLSRKDELSAAELKQTWSSLIRLQLLRGDMLAEQKVTTGRALLQEAVEQIGRCKLLADAELSLAGLVSNEEMQTAAERIATQIADYPVDERTGVLEVIAATFKRLKKADRQADIQRELAKAHPGSLNYRLQLAQSAIEKKDEAAFTKELAEVRRIEGPNGPYGNLAEALWEEVRINRTTPKALTTEERQAAYTRAVRLLDDAAKRRPNWQAVPLAQGRLAAAVQDDAKQYEAFRKAIDLGTAPDAVYEWLLAYLERSRRFDELTLLHNRVRRERPTALTPEVTARLANSYFYQQKQDEAFELARQSVAGGDEVQQRILEGRLQLIEYRALKLSDPTSEKLATLYDSIKENYEAAAALAPENERVWLGYVIFHLATNNGDAARAVVERAGAALPETPPEKRALTLAALHELAGEVAKAREHYQLALAPDPKSVEVNAALAQFYARTNDRSAEALQLKRLKSLLGTVETPISRMVDSRLDYLEATGGTYSDAVKVVERLEQESPNDQAARLQNLKTQAAILSRYNVYEFQVKLIKVLEQIRPIEPIPVADRITLIGLYGLTRQNDQATAEARQLVAQLPNDRLALAYYLERCIEQEDWKEAETHLKALDLVLGNSFTSVGLRARLEHGRGNTDAAVVLLDQYIAALPKSFPANQVFWDTVSRANTTVAFNWLPRVADPAQSAKVNAGLIQLRNRDFELAATTLAPVLESQSVQDYVRAERIRGVSALLDSFGRLADAEKYYRQYLNSAAKPTDYGMLVSLVGRQGRLDEALDLCEQHRATVNAGSLLPNAVALLRQFPHTPADEDRVQALMNAYLAESPDNPEVLRHLADFHDFKGEFDAAEATYQKILAVQPNHILALNNLAWLLSMRQPTAERVAMARKLIDQAIELIGPVPELLDTKGVVELADRKAQTAIALLKRASAGSPSAGKELNLARAYLMLEQPQQARSAYQNSVKEGLDAAKLHPLELPAFKETQQRVAAIK